MENNQIDKIMETTMNKLRTLVDVNTIVGSPVSGGNGTTIVPFSKVSMGFIAGGGEYSEANIRKKENFPFAGGSGAGFSVSPVGFLIFDGDKVKIVNMEDKSNLIKMIESLPDVVKAIIEKSLNTEESHEKN